MPSPYTILSVVMLLASTLAVPHDEDETTASPTPQPNKVTKTVVVTVTQTSDMPSQPPAGSANSQNFNTATYTSGLATPLPTGRKSSRDIESSSTQLRATPTLICSDSTDACIVDGIAIWPSGTTSIVIPNLASSASPSTSASLSGGTPPDGSKAALIPAISSESLLLDLLNGTTCPPHSTSPHFIPEEQETSPPLPSSSSSSTAPPTTTNQSVLEEDPMLPIDLGTTTTPPYQPATTTTAIVGNGTSTSIDDCTATTRTFIRSEALGGPVVAWAGMDDALNLSSKRRRQGPGHQENKGTKRREWGWSRLFVGGVVV